ncbi:MAG TPA: NAD-dependent epimerase/dehydratase family protein [Candidatus Limnocylindria bacterium]|nr:NAD-dependent epimerase/dehydratase family protein [Candidatus Limnocylindria bacterium]
MTRVAVTGATGFIGANLARRLISDGDEVHLLVRPGHDPWRIADLAGTVRVHEVDLTDAVQVRSALAAARPDRIFHLAAYGAYAHQQEPAASVTTNVLGTIVLLEAARSAGVSAFVYAGTSSEYGFADHAPAEDERCHPNSLYAVTKLAATEYCAYVARRDGARVVSLRLYSAYGPWEEPTRLVPQLILAGLEGRLPPLVDPTIARDLVHVDDVCEAFVVAAGAERVPSTVYNVGTGTQTTLREIVDAARRTMRISAEPRWGSMPDRAWDTGVWVADPRRIEQDLGWRARTSFADGLARTVDWLRDPAIRSLYTQRLGASRASR